MNVAQFENKNKEIREYKSISPALMRRHHLASIQAHNYICKLWPDATVASAAVAAAAKIIEFASQRKCKLHSIDAHNKDYMDLLPR